MEFVHVFGIMCFLVFLGTKMGVIEVDTRGMEPYDFLQHLKNKPNKKGYYVFSTYIAICAIGLLYVTINIGIILFKIVTTIYGS